MSMFFAYMAGGERVWGLEVLRGGQTFFYLLCVCGVGGGWGVRFSTSPSVKKITEPPPFNK